MAGVLDACVVFVGSTVDYLLLLLLLWLFVEIGHEFEVLVHEFLGLEGDVLSNAQIVL